MFKRLIALFVTTNVILSYYQPVYARDFSVNELPVPGTMVGKSAPFTPLALKGLVINPQKPLQFQFIVDTGRSPQDAISVKTRANQLVKYFLAGLTIPEGDLWVNLSPYEKNRMVPEALGETDLGRDLLAQDYILKQLTASLIYPEKDLGKEFWSRVYAKAQQQFGTTNVPVNTFNKVWILPDQAQVFEHGAAAYVTKATLKVMLDEDYLALQKHVVVGNGTDSIGANIVREIVIPEITKEVNTGKNFAPLRQIFQALILAKWYKENIQNGLLDAVYTNKNKVVGINLNDPAVKEQIYERYLMAYKKGAFNFIKEDPTPDGQVVPRKYFSGGITHFGDFAMSHSGKPMDVLADGPLVDLDVNLKDAAMVEQAQSKIKLNTSVNFVTLFPVDEILKDGFSKDEVELIINRNEDNVQDVHLLKKGNIRWSQVLASFRIATTNRWPSSEEEFHNFPKTLDYSRKYYTSNKTYGRWTVEINNFQIEYGLRKKGIGRIFYQLLESYLLGLGFRSFAVVGTCLDNEETLDFWKRQGYREHIALNNASSADDIVEFLSMKHFDQLESSGLGGAVSSTTLESASITKAEKESVNEAMTIKQPEKGIRRIIDRTDTAMTAKVGKAYLRERRYAAKYGIGNYFPHVGIRSIIDTNPLKGGIDLNQINVNRNGKTITVQFDQAQLNELENNNFKGFIPVVIGFQYIQSPFPLLGINNPAQEPEVLAKA